jgi:ATP-dependent DNA helicase RecQ
MTDPFLLLREVLAGRPPHPLQVEQPYHASYRRLFQALSNIHRPSRYAPGTADLAVLTRHVLRHEQEMHGGTSPILAVPGEPPWPSLGTWERYGVEVLCDTKDGLAVRSMRWAPPWLNDSQWDAVDKATCAEAERRDYGEAIPGDPFLDRFPAFSSYRCAGQREAIRGVLCAPEGSSLAVNLPTGSGKSLAAYLPSLLDPTGLTVVVVPTTALAIDQERAIFHYIGHPTAYHSGTDAAATERNRAIRERIRAGSQRIVFTSPESLIRSLSGLLYLLAPQGLFRLLVIDEAHIVDQWGDDFRAEFQEIAGLRRDLLRRSPKPKLRTLLLTGTMTEPCLDTLETLFGRPGPFSVLSAVQLRPEPSYWVQGCDDENVRNARVLEAVGHLPRPLILYVSRVQDAYDWLDRLTAQGFRRMAVVTGKTLGSDREEAIRAWQADELDIVVATSAFGLGMDKATVRAVIHACLPEHIDRFYQEVGRGGRDGKACVSLLLHTPADLDTARRLNRKTLISTTEDNDNKGYERWKAMYGGRQPLGDGRVRVPLSAVPEYGYGEFENNTGNIAWNLRTLTLLARAGVIELDAQPPPRRDEHIEGSVAQQEERLQQEYERHRLEKVVRIIDDAHLDLNNTWRGGIEDARSRSVAAAQRGLDLLTDAIQGRRCLADIFAEAYALAPRSGHLPRAGAFVVPSCGGCPACRRNRREPYAGGMPRPASPWPAGLFSVPAEVERLLGYSREAVLFDERLDATGGIEKIRRERLLRFLIAQGFRTIVAPEHRLAAIRPLFVGPDVPPIFFAQEWEPFSLPPTPVIVIDPPDSACLSLFSARVQGVEPPRLIWIAAERRDPQKPHCLLRHTLGGQLFRLEEFCTGVGL